MFSTSSGANKRLIAEDENNYIYFNAKASPNDYISETGDLNLIPNSKARECLFIAGSSGSGKSTYASKYVEKWLKIFPQCECFLFSRKDKDPVFDKETRIRRVKITDDLIKNPVNVTTDFLPNSLVIFDDIDSLEKHYYEVIARMILDILEVGRSYKIYCIVINHLLNPNNRKLGRVLHNESHYIVIFNKDNIRAQRYFLNNYMGYDKQITDEIINAKDTRSITIYRHYPNFILTDSKVWSP